MRSRAQSDRAARRVPGPARATDECLSLKRTWPVAALVSQLRKKGAGRLGASKDVRRLGGRPALNALKLRPCGAMAENRPYFDRIAVGKMAGSRPADRAGAILPTRRQTPEGGSGCDICFSTILPRRTLAHTMQLPVRRGCAAGFRAVTAHACSQIEVWCETLFPLERSLTAKSPL